MNKVLIFSLMAFVLLSCKDDEKVALTRLKVSPFEISVTEGESVTATATPVPADAEDVSYTWSSEDPSIATAEGGNEATVTVTGVKEGTTNIVVSSGSISTKTPVTVTPKNAPSITFSKVPTPPTAPSIDESDYTSYYFDPVTGNDANAGTSETQPMKTLAKAAEVAKNAKTKILLRSGSSFVGQSMNLGGLQATESKPLILDVYGGSERASIETNGLSWSAVQLLEGNIRIRNLRISNKGGFVGLLMNTTKAGACKNIVINNCLFEEINWEGNYGLPDNPATLNVQNICLDWRYILDSGGIIMQAYTPNDPGPSWYEDIFITNNTFRQVCRTAIYHNTTRGFYENKTTWYPAKNIVIQNNDMRYIGGDGVVLLATVNSFIDHNTLYHAFYLGRTGYACAGLWPHSSENCVMQYNEVAYTHLPSGCGDGEGLDVDIACENTLVQYNYVHHNSGGGLLICDNTTGGVHRNTVVRNNVFFDNGGYGAGGFITVSSRVNQVELYNNTIVTTSNPCFIITADWGNVGNPKDFTFTNNLFVSKYTITGDNDGIYRFWTNNLTNYSFNNNLFWQIGDVSALGDARELVFDPQITAPTAGYDGFDKALLFVPKASSVFTNGVPVEGMLEKDLAGNSVSKYDFYLGAFAQ